MPFRQRPVTRLMGRCFSATAFAALLSTALLCQTARADELADIQRLLKGGQQAQALSRVDAALSNKPRDPQMRFMKGVALAEMNRVGEAIPIFARLTEEFPYLPEPWNNLAVLYAGQGQLDKARVTLERAIQTNPSYAAAYENLGDIHARLASQAYDRALQVDSGNANAPSRLNLVRGLATPVAPPPLRLAENTVQLNPPGASTATKPAQALPPLVQAPAPAPAPAARPSAPAPAPVPAAKPSAPASAPVPAAKPSAPAPAPTQTAKPAAPPATTPLPAAQPAKPAEAKPAKPDPAIAARERARRAEEAEREAVLATVHGWARDWSARNVKGYLDHYAGDFETPGRQSRKAWAEERQARIVGKGRINVKVESPQVSVEGNRATVRFRQQYTSDRLTVSSRKTLVLVRQRGKWLIQKESTGS